jgi:hypothetical protein
MRPVGREQPAQERGNSIDQEAVLVIEVKDMEAAPLQLIHDSTRKSV